MPHIINIGTNSLQNYIKSSSYTNFSSSNYNYLTDVASQPTAQPEKPMQIAYTVHEHFLITAFICTLSIKDCMIEDNTYLLDFPNEEVRNGFVDALAAGYMIS